MTTDPTPAPRSPRRAGLLGLQINAAERRAFNAAAMADGDGKGITVWIREQLIDAARRRANPPDPLPTPLPPYLGPRPRGRQALRVEDRRNLQERIGLTAAERGKIETAAKRPREAGGQGRNASRWARAVLYAAIGEVRGLTSTGAG